MTRFFIRPNTVRPDFRLAISFLWGDLDKVDTEGNADNPASREWTELYGANRECPHEAFEVQPLAGDPLTLCITSKLSELAARVAYFLAIETKSLVAASGVGPWHYPPWLANKMGEFDLAEATKRVAQSRWRQATPENPYPGIN